MSNSAPAVKPVIRRSHTKSKSGCQNCRTRRIKCDEVRPNCLNCFRGGRMCNYPASAKPLIDPGDAGKADSFSWPTEVDQSCEDWKRSGQPPFPVINLVISPHWNQFSLKDMRYMHYLGTVASLLEVGNVRKLCLCFVKVAVDYDFLAYAMMGQAAGRLAIVSKSEEAFQDASTYRYLAVKGLNKALASFSMENSDALLCTSHVLSSQEPNWKAWKSIVEGISAVVRSSRPWIEKSILAPYLDLSSTEAKLESSSEKVIEGRHDKDVQQLLEHGISSLGQLSSCPQEGREMSALLRQLRDALRTVHDPSFDGSRLALYRIIHPITAWMNRYNISYTAISERRTLMLAALSHFFAVPILLHMLFSSMEHPLLSVIRERSISEIGKILEGRPAFFCDSCRIQHRYHELMLFPIQTAQVYRLKHQS